MEHTESLESFFWGMLGEAMKERCVAAEPATEHYLVQLLTAYASQPVDETPLALKLLAAREAAPSERRRQLREVGDTSLFVSGFWSDSFARAGGRRGLPHRRGRHRLRRAARTGRSRDPFGNVYEELAEKFARFVSVLTLLSSYMMPAATRRTSSSCMTGSRPPAAAGPPAGWPPWGVMVPSGGRPQ